MAETKYESKVQSIPAPVEHIYPVLSNLKNLDKVKHLIPQDKIQEIEIDSDYVRMKVDGLGQKFMIRIEDRIENDAIKFGVENLPIQFLDSTERSCTE